MKLPYYYFYYLTGFWLCLVQLAHQRLNFMDDYYYYSSSPSSVGVVAYGFTAAPTTTYSTNNGSFNDRNRRTVATTRSTSSRLQHNTTTSSSSTGSSIRSGFPPTAAYNIDCNDALLDKVIQFYKNELKKDYFDEEDISRVVQNSDNNLTLPLNVRGKLREDIINFTKIRSVRKAHKLLLFFEELYNDTSCDYICYPPSGLLYFLVINGYAKQPNMATKAERILINHMRSIYFPENINKASSSEVKEQQWCANRRHGIRSLKPELLIKSYTTVLDAYARQATQNPKAADHALKLLKLMEQEGRLLHNYFPGKSKSKYNTKEYDCEGLVLQMPNRVSYNAVLNAFAKSRSHDAGEKVETLLNQMVSYKNPLLAPDIISYTSAIDAWTRLNQPAKAENVIRNMLNESNVQPNLMTYNTVINAWAKGGNINRVESLISQLEKLAAEGNVELKPDFYSYTAYMDCLVQSQTDGASQKAEEILQMMENCAENGEQGMKPTIITYNVVLKSWAMNKVEPFAAQRAEDILRRMISMYETGNFQTMPDIVSFNTVLNAWAKSKLKYACFKADDLLKEMIEVGVEPDVRTYASVIQAWGNSRKLKAPARSQELLDELLQKFHEGNSDLKPNVFVYTAAINSWARSPFPEKAVKAEELLDGMIVEPTIITYNSVLNACATTPDGSNGEQLHALNIALGIRQRIQKSKLNPDHSTYTTFLKVFMNLIEPGEQRRQLTEEIYRQCKSEGLLKEGILHLICRSEPSLFRQLHKEECEGLEGDERLPKMWSQNF